MSDKIPYVLLADDDADDRVIFKEALNEINAQVHFVAVEHGNGLMELLNGATLLPDMIFLDINMPIKNGKECLAEIKSNKTLADIAVIIFSTSSNQRDIDETYKSGANLYLEKPYSFTVLADTLSKLLALDWSNYKPQPPKEMFLWKME